MLSLFGMVSRRVKKVIAWVIAIGILLLLGVGLYYITTVI